ncbi:MAG TPA: hypothetical protein VLL76_05925, partial [Candidatus Omnitrophota bacterium]|nr:hypothetical protein [Candidatus Omnitrophota bacterium]
EQQFSIQGASALFRKRRLIEKVAARITKIDKGQAYRLGIGPLEYDAILEHRVSAVDVGRLESIFAKLAGEAG